MRFAVVFTSRQLSKVLAEVTLFEDIEAEVEEIEPVKKDSDHDSVSNKRIATGFHSTV